MGYIQRFFSICKRAIHFGLSSDHLCNCRLERWNQGSLHWVFFWGGVSSMQIYQFWGGFPLLIVWTGNIMTPGNPTRFLVRLVCCYIYIYYIPGKPSALHFEVIVTIVASFRGKVALKNGTLGVPGIYNYCKTTELFTLECSNDLHTLFDGGFGHV